MPESEMECEVCHGPCEVDPPGERKAHQVPTPSRPVRAIQRTDLYEIDCARSKALGNVAFAMVVDREQPYVEAQVLLSMALDLMIRSGDDVLRAYDATIANLTEWRASHAKREAEAAEIAAADGR